MESLRTSDGNELGRVLAQRILQELIEAEAIAHIGAEPGEHAETRTTWRNGHRKRALTTQAGEENRRNGGSQGGEMGVEGYLAR
ncbi:hypothetical protein GCM10010357_47400 [Streptomyces luteireticuli]|uniref:IS256 family transposase n=1 Tax=Streptomyces luteireticuli TaxID=173858 RepID=A0ABN0YY84_9ACTN